MSNGVAKLSTNGILEYSLRYSFDQKANQDIKIEDSRYWLEKSPIWDDSDDTIFCTKYMEQDDMFSVLAHPVEEIREDGTTYRHHLMRFTNMRYGTNIFHAKIEFPVPFINDEYMVFFDTYGYGEFVFGYDSNELAEKDEPTYDAVVSMPMLMNKRKTGFDIVLPIHSHFNSMQKHNIGVPWNNKFTLQVIGRAR